jgi:hypothetical protein
MYWYYDPQWHIVSAERVPKECLELETNSPESFPYNSVKWLPSSVYSECPVRLFIEVESLDTLVDFYMSVMFDEPAAYRDSVAEANQKELEEQKKLRDAEQVKPTF